MRAGLLAAAVLLLAAAPASAAPELVKIGDFTDPVHVASPPNDTRVFVVEQGGLVKIAGAGTFIDLTAETLSGGERGLLSIAFASDYAASGRFYVFLTSRPAGNVQVREYRGSTLTRMLLDVPHDATNHNGGQLQFGPDGALYVSIGDNADPSTARDPASPFGKIHRIDIATGARQVWSSGLRNPWRFSFDRSTGDLLIGDVGSGDYEEVNWSQAPNAGQGVDYGWGCGEGANQSCGTRAAFWHENGPFCAIIGGHVVRDPGLPSLNGRYLYGDNCDSTLWSAALGAGGGTETALEVSGLSSFGEDACGRIYAASRGSDAVYRIQEGTAIPCAIPVPAPVPEGDTAAPGLSVRILRPRLNRRRLRVAIRCSEPCRAAISTRLRRVKRLSTRRRSLAAGRRTVVPLKLGRATARKLRRTIRRRRYVRVVVTVRATDEAGNRRTVKRRGRITRRR